MAFHAIYMGGGEGESIEAAAAARRERLGVLKAAQELLNTPDDDDDDENEKEEEEEVNVSMKFRNYLPHDKQLQEGKVAPLVLPKFEDPVLTAPPPPEDKKEVSLSKYSPQKPNWDLRRDVQKRLDKLERHTQKAMLVLMV
ncbi:hypothetical protein OROGR_019121 [Orobanche gracilis]